MRESKRRGGLRVENGRVLLLWREKLNKRGKKKKEKRVRMTVNQRWENPFRIEPEFSTTIAKAFFPFVNWVAGCFAPLPFALMLLDYLLVLPFSYHKSLLQKQTTSKREPSLCMCHQKLSNPSLYKIAFFERVSSQFEPSFNPYYANATTKWGTRWGGKVSLIKLRLSFHYDFTRLLLPSKFRHLLLTARSSILRS